MATNLNKDAVFTKRIEELDPASTLANADLVLVSQGNITRKATVTQVRATLATSASVTSHTGNTNNPHATTASQVGAFTTQQTTAAIATAQTTVQTNLDTHTGNTSNPHATTAAQVGAPTLTVFDSTEAVNASHRASTSNPHSVTPAQLGNATAQWNADQIQSKPVSMGTPANGQILIYRSAGDNFVLENNPSVSLASPAFTGTPTAPTQAITDNSTRLATTAYVNRTHTTDFFYAERTVTNQSITNGSIQTYSTNWNARHGAAAFSGGLWTCPRTGWYEFCSEVRMQLTSGTTFTRAYADFATSANVVVAQMFDVTPSNSSDAASSNFARVFLTAATAYRMRFFATHNGTVELRVCNFSAKWSGLLGLAF